jgi:hypothetical protein
MASGECGQFVGRQGAQAIGIFRSELDDLDLFERGTSLRVRGGLRALAITTEKIARS